MNRFIQFGSRITLNYKPLRGLGVREIVLLGLAAGQAIYLIFLAESISFPIRLTLAMFLAVLLLAIATVPVRGYKVEYFLFNVLLRGLFRPRRYLHQTAIRDRPRMVGTSATQEAAPEKVNEDISRVPATTKVGWGEWAGPNLAIAMTLFIIILLTGSVIAYVSKAGAAPFH